MVESYKIQKHLDLNFLADVMRKNYNKSSYMVHRYDDAIEH